MENQMDGVTYLKAKHAPKAVFWFFADVLPLI